MNAGNRRPQFRLRSAKYRMLKVVCAVLVISHIPSRLEGQECQYDWSPGFGTSHVSEVTQTGTYYLPAMTVFDDGRGPALYLGGRRGTIGNMSNVYIGRWDGSSWEPLGSGVYGGLTGVTSLVEFDDGSGPALYVGGNLSMAGGVPVEGVARWDGSSWSRVGDIHPSSIVRAMAVFDDGNGAMLYATANYLPLGGFVHPFAIRWDGAEWQPIGPEGTADSKFLLPLYDGPRTGLYSERAWWDGTQLRPLVAEGGELRRIVSSTNIAMTIWDDGSGPALYAGGSFETQSGAHTYAVARWDGTNWLQLGGEGPQGIFYDLLGFSGQEGDALYAAGFFFGSGYGHPLGLFKWDGQEWIVEEGYMGPDPSYNYHKMCVYDDGEGAALYIAGRFLLSWNAGFQTFYIAKRRNRTWSTLGNGIPGSPFVGGGGVTSMARFDEPSGPMLYAGGYYMTHAGTESVSGLARWNGARWLDIGGGVRDDNNPGQVWAMTQFDDEGGPALYIAGRFNSAGGAPASNVARWDGAAWSPLGTGTNSAAGSLHVYDDGNGPALYVGGIFTEAGGMPASRIARWDGLKWSAVGEGVDESDNSSNPPRVLAMTTYDDGSGPKLIVGGHFNTAGGSPFAKIASWDGKQWSSLAGGIDGLNAMIMALAVYDDGNGDALYAAGSFPGADGVVAPNIAKWDGSNWHDLDGGVAGYVYALRVVSQSNASFLLAGGLLFSAGGEPPNGLAAWNGSEWSTLGTGVSGGEAPLVFAIAEMPSQFGNSVYVGGGFSRAGPHASRSIARWAPTGPRPAIVKQPVSQSITAGDTAVLTVLVASEGDYAFQWRKYGDPLTDNDRISGATSSTLVIESADLPDSGRYDVLITGTCGLAYSRTVLLMIGCWQDYPDGDLNGDGLTNGEDIQLFMEAVLSSSALAAGVCTADFNSDGVVTPDDIHLFVAALLTDQSAP